MAPPGPSYSAFLPASCVSKLCCACCKCYCTRDTDKTREMGLEEETTVHCSLGKFKALDLAWEQESRVFSREAM